MFTVIMKSHISRILMKFIGTSAGASPSTHRRHRGEMQNTYCQILKITHHYTEWFAEYLLPYSKYSDFDDFKFSKLYGLKRVYIFEDHILKSLDYFNIFEGCNL